MKLSELKPLSTTIIPADQVLYRVQRAVASPTTVTRGPLKLAPPGACANRFDVHVACAYLAATPLTALYEARFRREVRSMSVAQLQASELVEIELIQPMQLLDLRPFAIDWPVLQSLRFSETQQLAAEAIAAGYDGMQYVSAQHHGQPCFVMFDPAPSAFRLRRSTLLANAAGSIHKLVMAAIGGSRVPLVP